MTAKPTDPTHDGLTRAALMFVMVAALAVGTWSIYTLLTERFGAPKIVALLGCAMFDGASLFFARLAQRYAATEDSGFAPRLAMLTTISASAWVNWTHAHMEGWGTVGGIILGGAPIVAEVAFELHHRYEHRDALRQRGRVPAALPVLGRWAWLLHPGKAFGVVNTHVEARLEVATNAADRSPAAAAHTIDVPMVPGSYAFTLTPDGYRPVPLLPTDTVRPALSAPVRRQSGPPAKPVRPEGTVLEDVADIYGRAHAPIVYFIRNGSRVKIGTSQNLRRRIEALCLRADDVLLVLHGDQRFERQLHDRFAEQRIGNTEWFDVSGDLSDFIATRAGTAPLPVREEPGAGHVLPLPAGQPDTTAPDSPPHPGPTPDNVADLVRGLLAEGVTQSAPIVAAAVELFGPDTKPDSVRRQIRRLKKSPPDKTGTGYYP